VSFVRVWPACGELQVVARPARRLGSSTRMAAVCHCALREARWGR